MEACLRDANVQVRCTALNALPRMVGRGEDEEVVQQVIRSLQDYSGEVRQAGCRALMQLAERGYAEAVDVVRELALHDEEPWVQNAAASALMHLGEVAGTPQCGTILAWVGNAAAVPALLGEIYTRWNSERAEKGKM